MAETLTRPARGELPAEESGRPFYYRGGAGFILCRGRQAIWETVTMSEMCAYLKEHGIRDAEYRRPSVTVIR